MSYALYQPRIEEARKYPQLWRLFLGVLIALAIFVLWGLGLGFLGYIILGDEIFAVAESLDTGELTGPGVTYGLVASLVGLGLGTYLASLILHGRGFGSLIGRAAPSLRAFVLAVLVCWGISAVLYAVTAPFSMPLLPNLDFDTWAIWLLPALFIILLQTGAEELLFRGYIQSQLAARFRAPWVWLILPSVVFGFAHYSPDLPVVAAAAYVVATTLFGLIAADLTARTGNLGAAWGFHFANNVIAIAIITADETLGGLALYKLPVGLDELSLTSPLILMDLGIMALTYLGIRRLLSH